jgi:hypothetical protein
MNFTMYCSSFVEHRLGLNVPYHMDGMYGGEDVINGVPIAI